ncbi:MAG: DNA-formamidopyrimidine glycosylase [Candidatus Pacebacteria bacterium]|jgi:formamidopyrimidine-DNA glycosylase|nr:DNA-formamidopyrimidine glycosylase [Candidatus Paceibacterota bacterium]
MPELPEVHTTVSGLQKVLPGLKIIDIWSDLQTHTNKKNEDIKNPAYFAAFKNAIIGKKVLRVRRRAKNILIDLSGKVTMLIHMKMTGHLLYGKYTYKNPSSSLKAGTWKPHEKGPLEDPFNRFIHVLFSLSNGKHLAFSDTRKFGKLVFANTHTIDTSSHLGAIGPEPLDRAFTFTQFSSVLAKKPNQKIKVALMDQTVIAGIGNIYSDEILWYAGVHPEQRVVDIPVQNMRRMFTAMKTVLKKGIDFSGDSTSDYRTITGERGRFHLHHEAYRRTGQKCRKRDGGVILRKKLGGRSVHFCSVHQALQK